MKNIHVLPTDKPSRLYLFEERLILGDLVTVVFKNSGAVNQNIYITSDEEIRVGDWVYNIVSKNIFKASKQLIDLIDDPNVTLTTNKKIILTTDQDLIKDGVQAIDDEFLEWFVKNPSCEEVMIDKFISGRYFCTNPIIPKEENIYDEYLKDELKKYKDVKTIVFNKPKQEILLEESLEEAAKKWLNKDGLNVCNHYDTIPSFIAGAKWQQERSYSEEEVLELWNWLNDGFIIRKSLPTREELIGWFETFKNK